MRDGCLMLHDKDGNLIEQETRSRNRLYKVAMDINNASSIHSDCARWHARLGHIGTELMKLMIQKELVLGIPKINVEKEICESCLCGKQTRASFPQSTSFRGSELLELVHGDLCGPITPSTAARNRYIFVLIDDHSRYMWTILLREKSGAFEKFKSFKAMVEQETKQSYKTFRTDISGKFTSTKFNMFCEESGVHRHLTAPYTPQQNGVVVETKQCLR